MSFTADFYSFSKKENSTARPSSPSFSYPIILTENCSLISPCIIVQLTDIPSGINYCYIEKFGRYYFINNWIWLDGRWMAELQVDVLATYRNDIASKSLYILRTSQGYDGEVLDTLYPAKKEPVITQYTIDEQWWIGDSFSYRNGWWVIGIVSQQGTTDYYAMDYSTFRKFSDKLLGTIDWANLNTQEISDNLTKTLFNPFQYVVSCLWFPDLGGKSGWFVPSSIYLGWWKFDIETGFEPYSIPDSAYVEKTIQLSFAEHPQAADRGIYLNKKPYRYCYLNIPPFGLLEIDSNLMSSDYTGYDASIRYDLISGVGMIRITGHNSDRTINRVIVQSTAQFGVPIQISDLKSGSILGIAKGVVGTALSIATGNALGALSGIGSAISDNIPSLQDSTSANGSIVGMSYLPTCLTICYPIVDENNADNGRPYCQNNTFSTLGTGFYIVENGSIDVKAIKPELEQIKSYLESGIYYA